MGGARWEQSWLSEEGCGRTLGSVLLKRRQGHTWDITQGSFRFLERQNTTGDQAGVAGPDHFRSLVDRRQVHHRSDGRLRMDSQLFCDEEKADLVQVMVDALLRILDDLGPTVPDSAGCC
jgi:hypothetical protein